MIFVKHTAENNHSARLIGDNMEALFLEAMKYVTLRNKHFYEKQIKANLETQHYAIVSSYSCTLETGLFIYYDPKHEITEEMAFNLSGRDIAERYEKIMKSLIDTSEISLKENARKLTLSLTIDGAKTFMQIRELEWLNKASEYGISLYINEAKKYGWIKVNKNTGTPYPPVYSATAVGKIASKSNL